jgi:hypothetical protein
MHSGVESRTDHASLRALGVFDYRMLAHAAQHTEEFLVQDLLYRASITIAVGSSGLGKTPLAISLGVAVAAGLPFFGHKTHQGPVLYCDAESGQGAFVRTLEAVSAHAGLHRPPDDFLVWSPNWGEPSPRAGDQLLNIVRDLKPSLVILDPLRVFWPSIERKSEETANVVKIWRDVSKKTGCSWFSLHHRRKGQGNNNTTVDLENDPHGWFEEAAGSHAIVNHSDTRIGIDHTRLGVDLTLAGFARTLGPLPVMHLAREFTEEGEPKGYRLLTGADFLNLRDKEVFGKLPDAFRFKDAHQAFGDTSGSTTQRFIKQCISAQILKKDTSGRGYVKIGGAARGA